MTNPYESPQSIEPSFTAAPRTWLRSSFFVINWFVATLLFGSGVLSILQYPLNIGSIAGLVVLSPILLYAACEAIAFFNRSAAIERILAYTNLVGVLIWCLSYVANIVEACNVADPESIRFLLVFVPVGAIVLLYLIACVHLRLKWTVKVKLHSRR